MLVTQAHLNRADTIEVTEHANFSVVRIKSNNHTTLELYVDTDNTFPTIGDAQRKNRDHYNRATTLANTLASSNATAHTERHTDGNRKVTYHN